MDPLQYLWEKLNGAKYYTKSYDEFVNDYSTPEARSYLYQKLNSARYYTKSEEEFMSDYFNAAPALAPAPAPKKKEEVVQPQPESMESTSEGGSLESQKPDKDVNYAAVETGGMTGTVLFGGLMPLMKPIEMAVNPSAASERADVARGLPGADAEEDYFTGAFGDVLRGIDIMVPIGIGDFVDDMARAVATGSRQSDVQMASNRLLMEGTLPSEEQIQNFINAQKKYEEMPPSKEMQDYQRTYEEEGRGVWGLVKGIAQNPGVIPEVLVSSLTSMATNKDALIAGASAIATGAATGGAIGAGGGTVALPVVGTAAGGVAGAATGAAAAVPVAFGLASTIVETGATFGELLVEELGDKEMTKENVRAILEDKEKYTEIRNKAIARGVTIGVADAVTGKLASGVGAKIMKGAEKATGAVTRAGVVKATAASSAIEAVGGSAGEAAARAVIGQEMDVSEIGLEGLSELPFGISATVQARFKKPEYKVNGERVTADEVDELLETMTPEQLATTKIQIKNDYQGRQKKLQDKLETGQIRNDVAKANPGMDEETLNKVVQLEKELRTFESNKTQSAKDRAAAIKAEIKALQEQSAATRVTAAVTEAATDIPEEIAALNDDETVVFTVNTIDEVPEEFRDRAQKKEGMEVTMREKVLGLPIGKETTTTIGEGYQYTLTGKEAKDYAVQKQSTDEVSLQPGAEGGETMAQGEPEAEPQGVAGEGQEAGQPAESKRDRRQRLIEAERRATERPNQGSKFYQAIADAIRQEAAAANQTVEEYLGGRNLDELDAMIADARSQEAELGEMFGLQPEQQMDGATPEAQLTPQPEQQAAPAPEMAQAEQAASAAEAQPEAAPPPQPAKETDPDLKNVLPLLSEKEQITPSFLQKKLKISITRAEKMMAQLEEMGVVQRKGNSDRRNVVIKDDAEFNRRLNERTGAAITPASEPTTAPAATPTPTPQKTKKKAAAKKTEPPTGKAKEEAKPEVTQEATPEAKPTTAMTTEEKGEKILDTERRIQEEKQAQEVAPDFEWDIVYESRTIIDSYTNSQIANAIRDKDAAEDALGKLLQTAVVNVKGGKAIQEIYEFGIIQRIIADDGSKIQRLTDYGGQVHGIPLINLTMSSKEAGMFFDGKKDFSLSEKQITDFFNSKFNSESSKITIKARSDLKAEKATGGGRNFFSAIGMTVNNLIEKLFGAQSNVNALVRHLNKSFPNVVVSTSKEAFNNVISRLDTELVTRGDMVLYGVTVDGDVYINPDVHNSKSELYNTLIHEFGHVWTDYLRTTERGRKIYEKGKQLIEEAIGTDKKMKDMFDAQMAKFDGDKDKAINEMMAILIGNKGEQVVNKSMKDKVKNWLSEMWDFVKQSFKMSKDLTDQDIQNMNMDDFLQTALADILGGEEISMTDAQRAAMRTPDAMFQATQSMESVIDTARQNGFTDAAITQVLKRMGYKAPDIKRALRVKLAMDIPPDFIVIPGETVKPGSARRLPTLPADFGNVIGGAVNGLKLFADVRMQLQQWVTESGATSWGDIREKMLMLLEGHPIYQQQSETMKMKLTVSLDAALRTTENDTIQRGIERTKEALKNRAIGAVEQAKADKENARALQRAKILVKNFIRTNLPVSSSFGKQQINSLIAAVANATPDNIGAQFDKVMNVVEKQRAKMKNEALRKAYAIISDKARVVVSAGRRRSGRGVDADAQAFFAQAKRVISAVIKYDKDPSLLKNIKKEIDDAQANGTIDKIIIKGMKGEPLTASERNIANLAYAHDLLANAENMQYEEVLDLLEKIKGIKADGIARFKAAREARAMENEAFRQAADNQILQLRPELFDEVTDKDGNKMMKVKDENQRYQDRAAIRLALEKGKVFEAIRTVLKRWDFTSVAGIVDFARNRLSNLGTLSNLLDNKARGFTFFYDNVYRPLNRMDEAAKAGYFQQMKALDAIANSIQGITKGYKQIQKMLQSPTYVFVLKGRIRNLSVDNLLVLYALSKNDKQAAILKNMGFTPEDMQRIKDILGPQLIEFADKLVDYFTNNYFDGINIVYRQVNGVNLGFINNFFPARKIQKNPDMDMFEKGDFNGVFNAQTASSLKERTAEDSDIELSLAFTDVVETYIVSMEKYKAYAPGVAKLNALFKSEAIDALLTEMGIKDVFLRSINFAISPTAGSQGYTKMDKALSLFTGYALRFKAAQLIKQAQTFIMGFEKYSYFPPGKKVPWLIREPVDLLMFMIDTAKMVPNLKNEIKEMYNMSANVRERLVRGMEGDIYGLESGAGIFVPTKRSNKPWARAWEGLKKAGDAFTIIGDFMSIMSYKVAYNRDIANGMQQEAALEKFNDYNADLQSRRSADKIQLQQNPHFLVKPFIMFGSATFLQMNNVMQSFTNMMRMLKEGKAPDNKDVRKMVLNLGVSNAMFTFLSYISKYMYGDEEEQEEVVRMTKEAAAGLQLLYNIPLLGSAAEYTYKWMQDDRTFMPSDVVNPYMSVANKMITGAKEEDVWKQVTPVFELIMGFQTDPFIGFYNASQEGFNEDNVYDMLGITKSYRPKEEEGGYEENEMTKEELKAMMPQLYDQLYGPGSPNYEVDKLMKDIEEMQNRHAKEVRDAAYGL